VVQVGKTGFVPVKVEAVQANIVDSLRVAIAQTQRMLEIAEWVVGTIPTIWPSGAMDLYALELPERSRRPVKPVEKHKDRRPQFDDYD
jgi:hypothetical protein